MLTKNSDIHIAENIQCTVSYERMTKLRADDVVHVSKLANLSSTSAEIKKFQKQLSSVVDYIDELSEVDTSGIEPTSQTTGLENVYREDEIDPIQTLSQEEAVLGTEKTYNGYFVVPMILEEKKDEK